MPTVAVILAGGQGARFWPLSRRSRPKPLLRLFDDQPMVARTLERVSPVIPPERVLVVTSAELVDSMAAALPSLPAANIIAEPAPRDTAPCTLLAALAARARFGPDVTLAVFPADHHIADQAAFETAIVSALSYARTGQLVTLGVTPTRPETGYGYLKFGDFAPELEGPELRARHLLEFIEKPDEEQALQLLREGRCLWNSGIFVFHVDAIVGAIAQHLPALLAALAPFEAALATDSAPDLADAYAGIAPVSLDHGVMEPADQRLTLPVSMGWSDIGSWGVLKDLAPEPGANVAVGAVHHEESSGSVLVADDGVQLVTLGVHDLVVVATRDATLICPADRAHDVRQLVDGLAEAGHDDLLE